MGNRAVITTAPFDEGNVGIYLHWNGGVESVVAFLGAAKKLGMRSPGSDASYAMARLVQIIANYFGGETSIGIGTCRDLDCDNGDNGTYLIGGDWEIVGRMYGKGMAVPSSERVKSEAVRDQAIEKTAKLMD